MRGSGTRLYAGSAKRLTAQDTLSPSVLRAVLPGRLKRGPTSGFDGSDETTRCSMGAHGLVKHGDRMIIVPDRRLSSRPRAEATHPATAPRFAGDRWPSPLFITALVLLLFLRPGLCEEAPADASTPGPVTASVLEAKVTEIEAAAGMEEEAKAKLAELYRKALGNLKEATSNAEAAEEFRRAVETAPARIQALREEIAASTASAAEESLAVEPSIPSAEIERLVREEKSKLAAEEAPASGAPARREDSLLSMLVAIRPLRALSARKVGQSFEVGRGKLEEGSRVAS